jgi:hypothetical protein
MAENTRIKMQRLKRSKSRLQRRQPQTLGDPLLPLRHLELPSPPALSSIHLIGSRSSTVEEGTKPETLSVMGRIGDEHSHAITPNNNPT